MLRGTQHPESIKSRYILKSTCILPTHPQHTQKASNHLNHSLLLPLFIPDGSDVQGLAEPASLSISSAQDPAPLPRAGCGCGLAVRRAVCFTLPLAPHPPSLPSDALSSWRAGHRLLGRPPWRRCCSGEMTCSPGKPPAVGGPAHGRSPGKGGSGTGCPGGGPQAGSG